MVPEMSPNWLLAALATENPSDKAVPVVLSGPSNGRTIERYEDSRYALAGLTRPTLKPPSAISTVPPHSFASLAP